MDRHEHYDKYWNRGGYDSDADDDCLLTEKTGYARVCKRARDQRRVWFYRFIPEPIFDNRTHVKNWNAFLERWDIYQYNLGPDITAIMNANVIFEDLRAKLFLFRGNPREYFRAIRYNQNYWEHRNISRSHRNISSS